MELIEEIKKNKVVLVFSVLVLIGFRFYFHQKDKKIYKDVVLINQNIGVEVDVKKTKLNRTELFINDSLIILSGLKMTSKKPIWLKKKSSRGDYVNYSFSDIKEPYRLIKKRGSKDVFLIKNGDTLAFNLLD